MNPVDESIIALWDKYHLPEKKRIHVTLVARVCEYIGMKVNEFSNELVINLKQLQTAALLHDIDNGVEFLPGERHPDAAVRILRNEQLDPIADIVKTHSLTSVLNAEIKPQKWVEKVLYVSDKMVKYEIITLDKRFALWRSEALPASALRTLDLCYPLAKKLELEIFSYIQESPDSLSRILA